MSLDSVFHLSMVRLREALCVSVTGAKVQRKPNRKDYWKEEQLRERSKMSQLYKTQFEKLSSDGFRSFVIKQIQNAIEKSQNIQLDNILYTANQINANMINDETYKSELKKLMLFAKQEKQTSCQIVLLKFAKQCGIKWDISTLS